MSLALMDPILNTNGRYDKLLEVRGKKLAYAQERGDTLTGIEIYSMLARQKFVRDSHWFDDLYRKPIYAAALEKDSNEIAKAETIGKEMKLW